MKFALKWLGVQELFNGSFGAGPNINDCSNWLLVNKTPNTS